MNEQLIKDLRALGVTGGDLLVHSAFSSLKRQVAPREFIDALRLCLDGGTLLLPTLSWANVTAEEPVFDVRKTPSCTGMLPQYFFSEYPGAVRSLHPTHSCAAVGDKAALYTCDHQLDVTPVGEHSPFRKLRNEGGKILFVGCGTEPDTTMHGVEELVAPDYLYGDDIEYTLTGYDGKTYTKVYHPHGFRNTDQRYERMEALLSKTEISYGKVLGADCVLMSAPAVWREGEKMLRKDQHYFVDIRN